MTPRRPSRVALTLLDRFVPGNTPLKGDLLEEFETRQSHWWFWRQVVGAVLYQRRLGESPRRQDAAFPLLGAVLLVIVSFEIVFVANAAFRLILGSPAQDIAGLIYLTGGQAPVMATGGTMAPHVWILPTVLALAVSMPIGWWLVGRLMREGQRLPIAAIIFGIVLWTAVNLSLPFAAQFASMLALVVGFLADGRLAVAYESTVRP